MRTKCKPRRYFRRCCRPRSHLPRDTAGLPNGPDGQRVAVPRQRHAGAEPIACPAVAGLYVGLLGPGDSDARKYINLRRSEGAVVGLVAPDPRGVAGFRNGPDGQRVAVPGQRHAQSQNRSPARCCWPLRRPAGSDRPDAHEHVNCAAICGAVVGLAAAYPVALLASPVALTASVLPSPDGDTLVPGTESRPGVAGLDVGLLGSRPSRRAQT